VILLEKISGEIRQFKGKRAFGQEIVLKKTTPHIFPRVRNSKGGVVRHICKHGLAAMPES
jgi:hypothetical protein